MLRSHRTCPSCEVALTTVFPDVYVIFDEGTDLYLEAASRVLEYLDKIRGKLPEGIAPIARPRDATGVGWA
jgi:Cu/Ag efflux pump CusA